MILYRRYFFGIVLVLALFIFNQTVFAASVELSLDDSITLALKNNYDIKIAKSDRENYFWGVKQAEANKGVNLGYTHTSERYSSPQSDTSSGSTYTNVFDNQISLSFPVYSGGKLENQIDQAKLELKVADFNVDLTKQQIKQDVITYYFNVLEYRNELHISQETVDNYKDHLKVVEAKYDIGMVAKTDVLASQVDLASAQDSLIKAQNNYKNAVATLNNAVGLPHDTEIKLKDDFKYGKNTLVLEDCINYAIANRLEINQYNAKIASAQDDIKIAKSGYLPTVDLSITQDWYDSHLPGTKNGNWDVSLTTSLSLIDSGLTKSKVKQAQYSLDKVQEQALQKRDAILLEVREYYLSMHEAEKRIETNKVSVNQAEENLMIEKACYEVGKGKNLDVLDAVLSLNTAKKNYTQALYDYNSYEAKLKKAMGAPVGEIRQ